MGNGLLAGWQKDRIRFPRIRPAGGLCSVLRIGALTACGGRQAASFERRRLVGPLARRRPRAFLPGNGQFALCRAGYGATRIRRAEGPFPNRRRPAIRYPEGLSIRRFAGWPAVHLSHYGFRAITPVYGDRELAG